MVRLRVCFRISSRCKFVSNVRRYANYKIIFVANRRVHRVWDQADPANSTVTDLSPTHSTGLRPVSMADSKVFRWTGTCHFYTYLWPCCFITNSLIYGAVFCYGSRATVTSQLQLLSLTSTLPHTNNSDLSHWPDNYIDGHSTIL